MALQMNSPQGSAQWTVLGYDVRSLGRRWLGAWRDFLFAADSPVRARFDEPVRLVIERGSDRDGESVGESAGESAGDETVLLFQGGDPLKGAAGSDVACEALAVPDSLYLARTLSVPLAAEAELDNVLAMELAANSPFDATDTVSGWVETGRQDGQLTLVLVVAARSALMHWFNTSQRERTSDRTELRAEHEGTWVRLEGFGEAVRDGRYRSRLYRLAAYVAAGIVFVFAATGLFVLQQRVMLQQLEAVQNQVMRQSRDAAAQRESLLLANESIAAANGIVADYPNPHVEIARFTSLLGDDSYLAHFSMRGRELRVRGRAADAARVMQTLSSQEAYASVTAPQAIATVGSTGVEQFYLDVLLADPAGDGP